MSRAREARRAAARGAAAQYVAPTPFLGYGDESVRHKPNADDDDMSRFGDGPGDEEEEVGVDRDWYLRDDDGGVAGDADHNPFAQYEDMPGQVTRNIAKRHERITARQAAYRADTDAWETNRMETGGVGGRRVLDDDPDEHEENRVHLMVHNLRPPFLDGKTVFTKQVAPVNPVRDPTGDLAIYALKGSRLVKEHRERAERAKAAGVTKVAFDRSGFKYHGRIKALADAARENGLEF